MYNNSQKQKWYALFVLTGEEENVKRRLQYKFQGKNLKFIVPKRRLVERKDGEWQAKIRILFPGYVLLNGLVDVEDYYDLKGTPGLVTILKSKHEPLEISEQEINIISRLICNDEIIGSSSVFIEGDRIIVKDGPLLGMDGIIESINKRKGRAKVRIDFIGGPRIVELSVSIMQTA